MCLAELVYLCVDRCFGGCDCGWYGRMCFVCDCSFVIVVGVDRWGERMRCALTCYLVDLFGGERCAAVCVLGVVPLFVIRCEMVG